MPYRLEIKRSALKELRRLHPETRDRIRHAVRKLSDTPRPPTCYRLKGEGLYALRIGDYRIIYDIDDGEHRVTILRIKHRREVYRRL
ncbi:MAG: type II toxin-antitoxin system RelE/ParE family toxin [Anaerolineae bacterium]|nr:type II toxin-antitoxin system RelE/ParE family toxin [Anaerolineae bacterium]